MAHKHFPHHALGPRPKGRRPELPLNPSHAPAAPARRNRAVGLILTPPRGALPAPPRQRTVRICPAPAPARPRACAEPVMLLRPSHPPTPPQR
ncbi:hypothetical protein ZWY2020_020525 [Hordeum vulgare]|nr:hypothetical protein ZWY2020_020525 [Hordeum vulgare]